MKLLLLALLALLALVSCNEHKSADSKFADAKMFLSDSLINLPVGKADSITNIKLPLENKALFIPTSLLVKTVTYVPLETNVNCLIKSIEQSLLYKDNVYILDNFGRSVLMFAKNGSFVKRIGVYGKGPQEYINPINITVDSSKDELYVFDDKSSKFLIYDLDGQFLREKRTPVRLNDMLIKEDGQFIMNTDVRYNFHLPEITNNKLIIVDSAMSILAKGNHYDAVNASGIALSRKGLHGYNNEVFYNPTFSYFVYKVNNHELKPTYFVDAGKYSLPDGFANGLKGEEFFAKYDSRSSNQYAYIGTPIFQNHDILTTNVRFQGRDNHLFYSKNSHTVFFGNAVEVIEDKLVILTSINGNDDNGEFYGFIESYNFVAQRDKFIENKNVLLPPKLLKVKEEDNPIVAFYTFKEF